MSDASNDPRTSWTGELAAAVMSSWPAGVVLFSESGEVTYSNAAFEMMVGMSDSEMIGQGFKWTDLTAPESQALDECAWDEVRTTGVAGAWEKEYVQSGGRRVMVRAALQRLPEPVGEAVYAGFFTDISQYSDMERTIEATRVELGLERRRLERRNRDSGLLNEMTQRLTNCRSRTEVTATAQAFMHRLFPETSGTIGLTGLHKDVIETRVHWGPHLPSRNRYSRDDCHAMRLGYMHRVEDAGSDPLCAHHTLPSTGQYLCMPLIVRGEVVGGIHIDKDCFRTNDTVGSSEGQPSWIEQMAIAVAYQLSLSLTCVDYAEHVQFQSVRDPLTGLFNRRYIEESIERELRRAHRSKTVVCVMLLNVDHMAETNSEHGQEAGDALMRMLANLIETRIRAGDDAARFGGDEIMILFHDIPVKQAAERGELLLQEIQQNPLTFHGRVLDKVTVTIGVCCVQGGSVFSSRALLEAVDNAVDAGKQAGGNQVVAKLLE